MNTDDAGRPMTEWEELDGPNDPDIGTVADRVISRVRRRRTRRSLLLGAGGLAVAAAVVLPLLPESGARDGSAGAAGTVGPRGRTLSSDGSMPDIAQIYAAALVGGPSSSKSPVRIYVRDHVCTAVPTNPGVQCDDRPISAEVQRSVRKLLGNKVEFVAHTQAPRRQGVSAVIVFGALTVTGAHATLGMEVLCGPLCGQGETLVLTRRDGRWRVTGTTGPEWIS